MILPKKTSPLRIHNATKGTIPEEQLINLVTTVYKREKIKTTRVVNLICCSDYTIRKLNRDYREKDKVTDVLSFPFADDDFLGEVYISVKRAEVQARRYGFSFEDEFLRLFLHGLLHLAGYDHIKAVDRDSMEAREKSYFTPA